MAYIHIPFQDFSFENSNQKFPVEPEAQEAIQVLRDALQAKEGGDQSSYEIVCYECDSFDLDDLDSDEKETEVEFILHAVPSQYADAYRDALNHRPSLQELAKLVDSRVYVYDAVAKIEYFASEWKDRNIGDRGKPSSWVPSPPDYQRKLDYTVSVHTLAGYIEHDGTNLVDMSDLQDGVDDDTANMLRRFFEKHILM